jgi:hypothetical protein
MARVWKMTALMAEKMRLGWENRITRITTNLQIEKYFYQCCGSRGSRTGKKSVSGSGMNNLDHISESLGTVFWVKILKFFVADLG